MSVNKGETVSVQDQVDVDGRATTSTSCASATTAATARAARGEPRRRPAPSTQPACQTDRRHRPDRLRQLVGLAHPGRCRATRSRASTSPTWSATRPGHRQPHQVRRARRLEPLRRRRADLRRDLAGLQHATAATASTPATSVCPPGNPMRLQGRLQGLLQPPVQHAEDDSGRSWLFSGGEYPMIRFLEPNGYDVSYVSGVDVHARGPLLLRTTSSSSRAATTSTGPRRSAPT